MRQHIAVIFVLLTGCAGIPEDIEAVQQFDVSRYTGKWYEVARLENRFEEGLEKITAEYNVSKDGSIFVTNSGYSLSEGKFKYAYGKAYFNGDTTVGSLKVSFFWPFYGGYHIVGLDKENYSYALVVGSNRDYLWILVRQPTLQEGILQKLKAKAAYLGFDVSKLVYPKQ